MRKANIKLTPTQYREARAQEYERGIAEGERRERARVVAWLLETDPSVDPDGWCNELAGRIEHGEHTKEGA